MKKSQLIFIILALAAGLLVLRINKPFYGYHDWNAITYSQIARNYSRYGLIKTRLGQVENLLPASPEEFRYDTHFPPLFTLALSIPVSLFGPRPWAVRLLPALFSLASVYLIYQLVCLLGNKRTALVAALLTIFTPGFIYFGKNPVHEPLNLFFILLNVYLFSRYLRAGRSEQKTLFNYLFFVAFLSLFSGWPLFYLMPLLALVGFIKTKQSKFFLFLALPFIVLGLHLLHVKLLTGSFSGGFLLKALLQRLNLKPVSADEVFTLPQFISRFLLYSRNMFTFPLLLTAFLGFFTNKQHRWLLVLLLTGFFHPLVFSNAGYLHDYLQFPGLAFISISSALFLSSLFTSRLLSISLLFALLALLTKLPSTKAMIHSQPAKAEYDLVQQIKQSKSKTIKLPADQAVLLQGVLTRYYLQKPVEFIPGKQDYFIIENQSDKLLVKPYEAAN